MKSNGEYKIENGVKIPARIGKQPGKFAIALKALKVGDSVWSKRGRTLTWLHGKNNLGVGKFTTRTEGEGTRIWRTK